MVCINIIYKVKLTDYGDIFGNITCEMGNNQGH